MATALDLLMSAKEDVNLLSEQSDICTIDAKTRVIFVPSTIVVGGVQSDKNAERIKFSCPKIVGDNLDLSKFSVRINFENVSSVDFNVSIKDQYICDDVAVDGENVTFSWLIGRNAARYMGTVRFIVCAVKTDSDSNISVEWNTAIAEVPVLEGIEIDQPQIGQEEKDVINQLLELTKSTSAEAVQNVNSAKEQAIKDIQSVSQPDTTLTIEGGLAEAKATGEAIGSLKEDIENTWEGELKLNNVFTNLSVGTLTGNDRHFDAFIKNRVSTKSKITATRNIFVEHVNSDFKAIFYFYDDKNKIIYQIDSVSNNLITINKGAIFNVMILRSSENANEIANVDEFSTVSKAYTATDTDVKFLKDASNKVTLNDIQSVKWNKDSGIDTTFGTLNMDAGKFCTDFIFSPQNAVITIDIPSGYIARLYIYNTKFQYLKDEISPTWSERHDYKFKLNDQYFRVSVSRDDYKEIDYAVSKECYISVDRTANSISSTKIKNYLISAHELPEYWLTHLNSKISDINNRVQNLLNYDQFLFITDLHINQGNSGRYGDIIDYIIKNTSVDKVICGGDMFTGMDGMKERYGIDYLYECGFNLSRNPHVKYLFALGNHDDGEVYDKSGEVESKLIYNVFDIYKYAQMEYTNGITTDIITPSRYIYRCKQRKTVYIFLDIAMPGTTNENYNDLNEHNQDWLYKSLLSIPVGYMPIIVTHIIWLKEQKEYAYDTAEFMAINIIRMASAYNSRDAVTLASRNYDFTDAVGDKIVLIQCGHMHRDISTTYNGINIVATTCDSFRQAYPIGSNGRSEGNITENALDIVTVDRNNKKIYHDRIGYGDNRSFVY